MKTSRPVLAALLAAATVAAAPVAKPQAPARALGPVLATTVLPRAYAPALVGELPDGRVLVSLHDSIGGGGRLMLFDAALASATTIIPNRPVPRGPTGLYLGRGGDSTLIIDAASDSLLLVTPMGSVCCGRQLPSAEVTSMGDLGGARVFGLAGGIVYHEEPGAMPHGMHRGTPVNEQARTALGGGVVVFGAPSPLVRLDARSLRIDTLAWIHTELSYRQIGPTGRETVLTNPFPLVDTWAVLSDGSLAVVRGDDSHIDWVRPDGTHDSTHAIGEPRDRLTLEAKTRIADSALGNPLWHTTFTPRDPATGQPGARPEMPPILIIPAALLADYRPYFGASAALADMDDNLWIQLAGPARSDSGKVYTIVNRRGEVVDRVVVPAREAIVGFGRGAVYLTRGDSTGQHLDRVRI